MNVGENDRGKDLDNDFDVNKEMGGEGLKQNHQTADFHEKEERKKEGQ